MHIDPFIIMVLTIIAFLVAFFAIGKAIYHTWFVVTGIRPAMQRKASLLGPFALFLPSLFEEKAQLHLRRLGFWLPIAIGAFAITLLLKSFVGQA